MERPFIIEGDEGVRDASLDAKTAMEGPLTEPILLVEINFSPVLRYASSNGPIAWNGLTWNVGRLARGSVSVESRGGGATARVNLQNGDNAISAIALSQGASDKEISIWHLYGEPPYSTTDAVKIFEGVTDGADLGDIVQFGAISEGMILWSPRLTCTAERFPHMQPAGTEIFWAGEKFILDPDIEAF